MPNQYNDLLAFITVCGLFMAVLWYGVGRDVAEHELLQEQAHLNYCQRHGHIESLCE